MQQMSRSVQPDMGSRDNEHLSGRRLLSIRTYPNPWRYACLPAMRLFCTQYQLSWQDWFSQEVISASKSFPWTTFNWRNRALLEKRRGKHTHVYITCWKRRLEQLSTFTDCMAWYCHRIGTHNSRNYWSPADLVASPALDGDLSLNFRWQRGGRI